MAAGLQNDRVIPFFDSHDVKLLRVLAGRGSEYCGRLAVAQPAGQDLIDQHVRRLNADANDPCNKADRRMQTFARSSGSLEPAQPPLLDFLDPLARQAKPRHAAAKPVVRILRQKRSFGGARLAGLISGPA